jgi:hypothetical protein
MKFQDLVGQRFNKLIVIQYVGKNPRGQSRWLCQCDCGKTHEALASHLKVGNIKSCGCLNTGNARREASTTHGMSFTPEWNSYHSAKKRCNPKFVEKYYDWSGRGIEFRFHSFEDFFAEVGPRPEPKHQYSLDRFPNNDGHYEKGNVRWATKKQQACNRRCDRCEILLSRIRDLEVRIASLEAEKEINHA